MKNFKTTVSQKSKNFIPAMKIDFYSSLKEMNKPLTLAICGLMIALTIALNMLTIQATPLIFISFEFLTYAIVGYLFGPVPAMIFGFLCDVLGYVTNPMGPYHPGFTFVAIVQGLLWGMLLYKKKLSISRIIISRFITQMMCNVVLNTFFVSMLYGNVFNVLIVTRFFKNIALLPAEIIICFFALTFLTKNRIIKCYENPDKIKECVNTKKLSFKMANFFKRKEFFYIGMIVITGSILVTTLYLLKEFVFITA